MLGIYVVTASTFDPERAGMGTCVHMYHVGFDVVVGRRLWTYLYGFDVLFRTGASLWLLRFPIIFLYCPSRGF